MTAVGVTEADGSLDIRQPIGLFPMQTRNAQGEREAYTVSVNAGRGYDLLPDGSFLMTRGPSGTHQQEIVLVQNWFSELPAAEP